MAAGKFGSSAFWLLVDGIRLTAMKLKQFSHKHESITEPDNGLGDDAEAHCPTGTTRTTISQGGGFFDTSTGNSHAALGGGLPSSPQSTPRVVMVGFAGMEAGAPFIGCQGQYTHTYEVMAELGGLTKANAEYRVAGSHEPGTIIQPLATQTADWDTEASPIDYTDDTSQQVIPITSNSQASPSVVTTPIPHGLTTGDVVLISGVEDSDADINGEHTVTVVDEYTFSVAVDASTSGGTGGSFVRASTPNGGAGYLAVTAASGFTNFVGKIRDSADGETFADLVTFSDNVSAPFAERVAVTGNVDRYLAFDGNVTGTGSITAVAGFSRG